MQTVSVNGAQLRVSIKGPADSQATVLLFNGAFCNLTMWDAAVPMLNAAGVRTIAHDCRGVGESFPAPKDIVGSEQFTFEQYADDAAALLDTLGVKSVVAWGTAWGARPAMVFVPNLVCALRHRARTDGVCLYDLTRYLRCATPRELVASACMT